MRRTIAEWFLRLSLSSAFLSAVADRFGLWGTAGGPNIAWGNWHNFVVYSTKLNFLLPSSLQPTLAWAATILELGLGIALLIPKWTRCVALTSGVLLLLFAIVMTVALGIKAPLNFSVFTASAGAFLLASLKGQSGQPKSKK